MFVFSFLIIILSLISHFNLMQFIQNVVNNAFTLSKLLPCLKKKHFNGFYWKYFLKSLFKVTFVGWLYIVVTYKCYANNFIA